MRPAVNQIEVSPYNTRAELCAFCQAEGIAVEAYSPLTKGTDCPVCELWLTCDGGVLPPSNSRWMVGLLCLHPVRAGHKFGDPRLVALAQKYQCTPAQILIRWSLQKGYICIPKSVSEKRIVYVCDVFVVGCGRLV